MSRFIPDPSTVLKAVGALALSSVAVGGALLYVFQNSLIYPSYMPPGSRQQVDTPDQHDMVYDDLTLETPDGLKIKAYLMMQPEDKGALGVTLILLHANAGNVGHRLPIAKVFYKKMGFNVLALSYRGYGLSEGQPSEKGINLDAQTALDYVLSHPKLDKSKIFLYGQSIGGAVSISLASRNVNRVHGLIVENTFLSLPKLVPHVIPYLRPVLFLLHQIWPSETTIATLPPHLPVLFLSGLQDELVPPSHMKRLFEVSKSDRKVWKEFEHGTHNDTVIQPNYFTAIQSFVSSCVEPDSEKAPISEEKSAPVSSSVSVASSVISSGDDVGSFELIEDEEESDVAEKNRLGVGEIKL